MARKYMRYTSMNFKLSAYIHGCLSLAEDSNIKLKISVSQKLCLPMDAVIIPFLL